MPDPVVPQNEGIIYIYNIILFLHKSNIIYPENKYFVTEEKLSQINCFSLTTITLPLFPETYTSYMPPVPSRKAGVKQARFFRQG